MWRWIVLTREGSFPFVRVSYSKRGYGFEAYVLDEYSRIRGQASVIPAGIHMRSPC